MKAFRLGWAIAPLAPVFVLPLFMPPLPALAQADPPPAELQIPPAVLEEIRAAPFSQLFTLDAGQGYAVKDKDYLAALPEIGLFTLWANVPSDGRLGVAVKYCFEDLDLANAGANLVAMQLLDGDTELVTIDTVVESQPAALNEVRPPQNTGVSTSFYFDPFYDPFYYSPFGVGVSYAPATYIPGVECSTGLALFDLVPVQTEIAALPEKTLQVRLLFSNGMTENWNLGGGTIREIKRLPTLEALP